MKRMSALDLRQSLGAALSDLEQTGEPIILEKHRHEVGVVVSMEDYRQFFAEKTANRVREALKRDMDAIIRLSQDQTPAEVLTRNMRNAEC